MNFCTTKIRLLGIQAGIQSLNHKKNNKTRLKSKVFSLESLLLSLESLEKLCGGGWLVCKPILVFSLSLLQAEQQISV